MRASLIARAVRPSAMLRAGDPGLIAKANPGQVKVWKTYSHTRNEKIRQLSPFEIDVMGPLFRDAFGKIRHKVEDNFMDVAPAFIFFGVMVYGVKGLRAKLLRDHRD